MKSIVDCPEEWKNFNSHRWQLLASSSIVIRGKTIEASSYMCLDCGTEVYGKNFLEAFQEIASVNDHVETCDEAVTRAMMKGVHEL